MNPRTAPNLISKTGRASLAPRREPYWHRLHTGLHVGYRVLPDGTGTWIAKRTESGKRAYHALGTHERFEDAKGEAERWARGISYGVSAKATTVKEACADYAADLRTRKSKQSGDDAAGRFRRLVNDAPIGRLTLDKLRTTHVRAWLHDQVDDAEDPDELRRAKDSANRNLASLKAALNFAMKNRLVATDAGWKTVMKFEGVGRRREVVLKPDQVSALLAKLPDDLRPLMAALAHVPSRPGEVAKLRVRDFDPHRGTLALEGKTGRRVVPLSTAAIAFFKAHTKGKLAGALLFAQAHGIAWERHAWKKPFREAADAAGLPDDVVAYTIRHTSITALVAAGVDSVLIARLAGTSVEMIQKHYEHVDDGRVRDLLDAVPSLVKVGV
ncbi:Phage integrase [Paraburkholderia ribeironis]|uniref:Phage integrase n=1 Tax=Paraburkholderia ribeironis TaxID=1247936 RepID=A0A1N7S4I7_9BURK|nr:tyrosine-type recombinase/integrase [Paraburkholderia ribeironis]SIT42236.1 Phage integrase [Paraburkholderia ribeironis]